MCIVAIDVFENRRSFKAWETLGIEKDNIWTCANGLDQLKVITGAGQGIAVLALLHTSCNQGTQQKVIEFVAKNERVALMLVSTGGAGNGQVNGNPRIHATPVKFPNRPERLDRLKRPLYALFERIRENGPAGLEEAWQYFDNNA